MSVNLSTLPVVKVNSTDTYKLLYYDRDINSMRYRITIACELANIEETLKKFEKIEKLDIMEADETTPIFMLTKFTSYVDTAIPRRTTYRTEEGEPIQALTIYLETVDTTTLIKRLNEQINPVVDFEAMSLEEYKQIYIEKYNKICSENIYAGVTVETEFGVEKFGGKPEDQRNLQILATAASATKQPIPYHMDKTRCKVYDWKTIIKVQAEIQKLILREQTYCNALNSYIRDRLTQKTEVSATSYGMELPEDITAQMNEAITQGILVTEMMAAAMSAVPETPEETTPDNGTQDNTDTTVEEPVDNTESGTTEDSGATTGE